PIPTAPPMPPGLARWAQSCDIAPLPDGLALGIRGYLLRSPGLTPAARGSLTASLLEQTMQHVAPPPPAGAPGEHILAAVLAEARRRDAARSEASRRARSRLLPPDPLAPPPPAPAP